MGPGWQHRLDPSRHIQSCLSDTIRWLSEAGAGLKERGAGGNWLCCKVGCEATVIVVQLRPAVPLLVEFLPKFLLSLSVKSLHIRDSFAVKYVYPSLFNPFDVTAIP